MPFTLAIVGRPNVGKSTLFNRLVGRRLAIVDDTPGVTRDRRRGEAGIGDLKFAVIDTAGFEDAQGEGLMARMRAQTERAVAEADAVLLVIDARSGLTPLDSFFANWLRKGNRPVILVANKCEGGAGDAGRLEDFAWDSAIPSRFRPSMARGWAISTMRWRPSLPTSLPRARRGGSPTRASAPTMPSRRARS